MRARVDRDSERPSATGLSVRRRPESGCESFPFSSSIHTIGSYLPLAAKTRLNTQTEPTRSDPVSLPGEPRHLPNRASMPIARPIVDARL